MKGGGEAAAAQHGEAASGFQEVKLAVKVDAVADVQTGIEIQQVAATAEQDVLAIVDRFGFLAARGGERVRGGTPAEERPRLKQFDVETGAAERGSRRQTGEPASRDEDLGHSDVSMSWTLGAKKS